MNWINLTEEHQLTELIEKSAATPQAIYKHSTRCSVSSVVLQRMKSSKDINSLNVYYLDIFQYRPLSNKIAEVFDEHHESPQILLIKNGKCVYTESHMSITPKDLIDEASFAA